PQPARPPQHVSDPAYRALAGLPRLVRVAGKPSCSSPASSACGFEPGQRAVVPGRHGRTPLVTEIGSAQARAMSSMASTPRPSRSTSTSAASPADGRESTANPGLRRWLVRGIAAVVAAPLVLGAAGLGYQAIATEQDQRAYPPPGQLVDVGGTRLHINRTGQGS